MSKKKVTRIGRRTADKARWTDAEVLALVDAVLLARDTELAGRLLMVLGSRQGVGADRGTTLADLKGIPNHEIQYTAPRIHDVDDAPAHLGRLLNVLGVDPTSRGKLKQLVARIGKELARGRAKLAAAEHRHRVPA